MKQMMTALGLILVSFGASGSVRTAAGLDPLMVDCFKDARVRGMTPVDAHDICKDIVKIVRTELGDAAAPKPERQAGISREWLMDCYTGNRAGGEPALAVYNKCKRMFKSDGRWSARNPDAPAVIQSADAGAASSR